jgi:hypothetical protein
VQFWRQKLQTKPEIEFPGTLVEPIAGITYDFSFAYMQEAFVSSLLNIAHHRNDEDEKLMAGAGGGDEDLDKYEIWRVINEQVKILRDEMDGKALNGDLNFTTPAIHAPMTTSHQMEYDEFQTTNPKEADFLHYSYSRSSEYSGVSNPSATRRVEPADGFPVPHPQFSMLACPTLSQLSNQLRGVALFGRGEGPMDD